MAGNRKAKTETSSEPSTNLEISEEEQWRLINETGILKKAIPRSSPVVEAEETEDTPLAEEIFNSVILIIPFSFLLLMFEILIPHQYGKHPTFRDLVDRMVSGVPILSVFIFCTTRYKQTRKMQFMLFVLSIIVGTRMIWLINHSSWLINMQQCPPLATVWVYTIVQLELSPSVVALAIVGGWMKWKGLKLAY
jgi:hypothetical protein